MSRDDFLYTVLLEVRVSGPDADWDDVARKLRDRVRALHLAGGFDVVDAGVDKPADQEPDA